MLMGSGRSSCSLNPESSVREEWKERASSRACAGCGCAGGCIGLAAIAGGFEASWGKIAFFQSDWTMDGTGGAVVWPAGALAASHPAGPHVVVGEDRRRDADQGHKAHG